MSILNSIGMDIRGKVLNAYKDRSPIYDWWGHQLEPFVLGERFGFLWTEGGRISVEEFSYFGGVPFVFTKEEFEYFNDPNVRLKPILRQEDLGDTETFYYSVIEDGQWKTIELTHQSLDAMISETDGRFNASKGRIFKTKDEADFITNTFNACGSRPMMLNCIIYNQENLQ